MVLDILDENAVCMVKGYTPKEDEAKKEKKEIPIKPKQDKVKPLMCKILVGDAQVVAIVDTGAGPSCISSFLLKKLQEKNTSLKPSEAETRTIALADGHHVKCRKVELPLTLWLKTCEGLKVNWEFVVIPDDKHETLLLGTELLKAIGLLTADTLTIPLSEKVVNVCEDGDDIVIV
jgi:predicted aspartyl protease